MSLNRIAFEHWMNLSDCKRWLIIHGHKWQLGRFEWNGEHYSWTPFGDEEPLAPKARDDFQLMHANRHQCPVPFIRR